MVTHLVIGGMSCDHCVRAVKEALASVPGVSRADVDLNAGSATVEHDAGVTPDALIQAVRAEDYDARLAGA